VKITDPCEPTWDSIWQRTTHYWAFWARRIKWASSRHASKRLSSNCGNKNIVRQQIIYKENQLCIAKILSYSKTTHLGSWSI
jgi:hypothetical protein